MTRLGLLRHGRTAWNEDGRLQGRADPPLSPAGTAALRRLRLPADWVDSPWYVSPLRRARQSAVCLGIAAPTVEACLIEMDFGRFEGRTLAELRSDPSLDMAALEARGLDFQPPGGESPRQVQARLRPWLRAVGAAGGRVGAITHKGVIRAVLAAACGWEMRGPPPLRLHWDRLHVFAVAPDGSLQPDALNLELLTR
jgi:probable phosphoglycerate mutase